MGNIILGYVRVSSREQINGTGIERQIKAIETFTNFVRENVRENVRDVRTNMRPPRMSLRIFTEKWW